MAELEERSEVMVAVENMFPFRADRLFGAEQSLERMRRRGGGPGAAISAFAPSYNPLDGDHTHYTLDLSHTATAGTDAVAMAEAMGSGLVHLHLCDGNGLPADEHLVPGRGTQPTVEVCQMLAASDFTGHVVLEVTTSQARTSQERGTAGGIVGVRPHPPDALIGAARPERTRWTPRHCSATRCG